jgi:hypothetical protein
VVDSQLSVEILDDVLDLQKGSHHKPVLNPV